MLEPPQSSLTSDRRFLNDRRTSYMQEIVLGAEAANPGANADPLDILVQTLLQNAAAQQAAGQGLHYNKVLDELERRAAAHRNKKLEVGNAARTRASAKEKARRTAQSSEAKAKASAAATAAAGK